MFFFSHCKGRENKNKCFGFRDLLVRFSSESQREGHEDGGATAVPLPQPVQYFTSETHLDR